MSLFFGKMLPYTNHTPLTVRVTNIPHSKAKNRLQASHSVNTSHDAHRASIPALPVLNPAGHSLNHFSHVLGLTEHMIRTLNNQLMLITCSFLKNIVGVLD